MKSIPALRIGLILTSLVYPAYSARADSEAAYEQHQFYEREDREHEDDVRDCKVNCSGDDSSCRAHCNW
jgi:hypothetical protein